jgi:hypothetical protein
MVAKTIKNHEYIYNKRFTILCKSKKQAEKLAENLIKNNETCLLDNWKLKENETWWVYECESESPLWKLKSTNGKISLVENV